MKRFNKIYIEISNVCNLNCSFCVGANRQKSFMTPENFNLILDKIKPYTDYIYYHVLGEPLIHPEFMSLLDAAHGKGFKSCITTNGSLLKDRGQSLIDFANKGSLHKISISLQAQEANKILLPLDKYMNEVCDFANAIEDKTVVVFRLWNEGGLNRNNEQILSILRERYSGEWLDHPKGLKIGDKAYIEFDSTFKWPDLDEQEIISETYYCYGLKDQLGILVDGTVIPCCLDAQGTLALGNIFASDLAEMLSSPRALAIINGFTHGHATEELCRKCGYAKRFTS